MCSLKVVHNMASAEALARAQQHLMGGDFVLDPVRLQSYKIQNDFGIFDFTIFEFIFRVLILTFDLGYLIFASTMDFRSWNLEFVFLIFDHGL